MASHREERTPPAGPPQAAEGHAFPLRSQELGMVLDRSGKGPGSGVQRLLLASLWDQTARRKGGRAVGGAMMGLT